MVPAATKGNLRAYSHAPEHQHNHQHVPSSICRTNKTSPLQTCGKPALKTLAATSALLTRECEILSSVRTRETTRILHRIIATLPERRIKWPRCVSARVQVGTATCGAELSSRLWALSLNDNPGVCAGQWHMQTRWEALLWSVTFSIRFSQLGSSSRRAINDRGPSRTGSVAEPSRAWVKRGTKAC